MIKALTANQNPRRFTGRDIPHVTHLSNMAGDRASGFPFPFTSQCTAITDH